MPHAIRIYRTGGPEVLVWEEVEIGKPGPGEARVRHTAVGVNFVDIYVRRGLYPVPLPSGLGTEAAGVIEEVGPDVTDLKPGDRVAYATGPLGAYSEVRVMPPDRLIVLPEGISDQQAAAMMLKGPDRAVSHPPDPQGRNGRHHPLPCRGRWGRPDRLPMVEVAGCHCHRHGRSEAKAIVAKAHGCEYPIIYTREDFVARVDEITRGEKLPVVYDSVGKDTFMKSLDCLRPRGLMVSFGQSSGPIGAVDLSIFAQKGSLFFTRPTLNTYAAKRADLLAMAEDLFAVVLSGAVKIEINQTYPLSEAAQAHRDIESRKTVGSTVLTI
ncbi:MAG: NADPH:quinone reductase [Rhodospirillaceae bacterium]|nr:NADPH:quinone reductase [Rhodospirillaceae bacterium]